MARYFTIEQATELLPAVERELRLALHIHQELAGVMDDLKQFTQRVTMMGGVLIDRQKLLALRGRAEALSSRLKEVLETVQDLGCQVKDLGAGLVDFPTLYKGREVLLCWKLGEPAIGHWHGLEAGFAGRQPIDEDFRTNHRGDEPA